MGMLIFSVIIAAGCCSAARGVYGDPGTVPVIEKDGSRAFILSGVPDLLQNSSYACGATAFRAVLRYWGRDIPEDTLVAMLHTTDESGTPPQNIVNASCSLGYPAEIRTDLTPGDLESLVRAGVPVMVGIEEHRNRSTVLSEEPGRNFGHWMVVIGFDPDNVWLEDPAVYGKRTVLSRGAFLARWQVAGKDVRSPDALEVTRMAVIVRKDGAGGVSCVPPDGQERRMTTRDSAGDVPAGG